MANELRVRQNFVQGVVSDNPLAIGATTLTSTALTAVQAIGATQHLPIILDPEGTAGAPEIAYITAHTASAGTATILRGQEGTTARQHAQNTSWIHGPLARDFTQTSYRYDFNIGSSIAQNTFFPLTVTGLNSAPTLTPSQAVWDTEFGTGFTTGPVPAVTAGTYLVNFDRGGYSGSQVGYIGTAYTVGSTGTQPFRMTHPGTAVGVLEFLTDGWIGLYVDYDAVDATRVIQGNVDIKRIGY